MTTPQSLHERNEADSERAARETVAALLVNTLRQADEEPTSSETIWDERARAEAKQRFPIQTRLMTWLKGSVKF